MKRINKEDEELIQKLTKEFLDIGRKHAPNPMLFIMSLKIAEILINKNLEETEGVEPDPNCDCENCKANRNKPKQTKTEAEKKVDAYRQRMH